MSLIPSGQFDRGKLKPLKLPVLPTLQVYRPMRPTLRQFNSKASNLALFQPQSPRQFSRSPRLLLEASLHKVLQVPELVMEIHQGELPVHSP